jgi:MoxR-like ATPase
MPQIYIDFPEEDEERAILKDQVPFAEDDVLEYVMTFLRAAHDADLRYSVRDGINVVRYAMKSLATKQSVDARAAVVQALNLALGTEEAKQFDLL